MLHTRPTHASIKFIFNEEAHKHYTGLFESNSVDYGIMSLSQGFRVPNMTNFFALSIRSFRDNAPASAIIAVSSRCAIELSILTIFIRHSIFWESRIGTSLTIWYRCMYKACMLFSV